MSDLIKPNNDHVICPHCAHQFRAIPVNVQTRIAKLEAEVKATHTIYEQARQHTIENVELKQEVARLSDHIRAIAAYHDGLKYSLLDGVRSLAWELHHTERRDFALSILEGK